MNQDISVDIVRAIVKDIHSRMGLEDEFRSIHPAQQIEIYERWIEIVSERLYQEVIVEEVYEPLDYTGKTLGEIVNRTGYYLMDEE